MSVGDGEELLTERLYLRPPAAVDAAAIIAIVGDWEVARRLSRVPHPYTHADFRVFLEQVVVMEPTWAIFLRDTNRPCLAEGRDKPSIVVELLA